MEPKVKGWGIVNDWTVFTMVLNEWPKPAIAKPVVNGPDRYGIAEVLNGKHYTLRINLALEFANFLLGEYRLTYPNRKFALTHSNIADNGKSYEPVEETLWEAM